MSPEIRVLRAVMPGTGEAFDLRDPEQVAAASYQAGRMLAMLRNLKETTDGILRDQLKEHAQTTLMVGDVEVTEETGKATYDAETIYQGLIDAGMATDIAEQHFYYERKVKDGRELNKLATRHDDYAKAITAGTKRSRGRIVTHHKGPGAAAPKTPLVIQQAVSSRQDAEAEAENIGI